MQYFLFASISLLSCWITSTGCMDLRRNEMLTWKNRRFFGFKGIKYGEPPIGKLRFKDPKPYQRSAFQHLNLEDLTQDGNSCPSPASNFVNEDCLHLNVFTRSLNGSAPVIVFIHPGVFLYGSGSSKSFGPEYLLEKDVVLVTINYRLGTFGFAGTGDARAPGNAGLKDQILALRWVQDNIEHFGGNARNVILMGASCGGVSIGGHMVSPMAAGLFHKAITISGAVFPQKSLRNDQLDLMTRQAKLLGCRGDVFECLSKADAANIARTMEVHEFDSANYLWLPVVEGQFGQERYLIKDPYQSLLNGEFYKVPFLTGCTKDEGASFVSGLFNSPMLMAKLTHKFNEVAPIWLQYDRDDRKSRAIKRFYFADGFTQNAMTNCFNDAIFFMPIQRTARLLSDKMQVFYYIFSYNGIFSESNSLEVHLDDTKYIFTTDYRPRLRGLDAKTIERFTSLIETFAWTGSPAVSGEMFSWPRFGKNEEYVDIGDRLTLKKSPFPRSSFGESIFP